MSWFKIKDKTETQRTIEIAEKDCWSMIEHELQYINDEASKGWSVMAAPGMTVSLVKALKELKERVEELEKER